MKACLVVGVAILAASGCSSSYNVSRDPAAEAISFAQLNERAQNRSITIVTTEGEQIEGTDLIVREDSTTLLPPTGKQRICLATSSVASIRIDDAGAGAVDGLIAGAVAGIPVGVFFMGLARGFGQPATPTNTLANIGGPIAGSALLGAIVGTIIQHTDRYMLQAKDSTSQRQE